LQLALENARRCFPPGSTAEATTFHTLGTVAFDEGALDEALADFEQALRIFAAQDPEGAKAAREYNNIGNVYFRRKDFARAGDYYQRALTAKQRRLGDKHPLLGSSYVNLGLVALQTGNAAAGEERCKQGLTLWEASLPKNHASLTSALDCVADAQRR